MYDDDTGDDDAAFDGDGGANRASYNDVDGMVTVMVMAMVMVDSA